MIHKARFQDLVTTRDTVVAVSLANLIYVRTWTELLTYTPANTYFMKTPPGALDYGAAMAGVLLTAALILAVLSLVRKVTGRKRPNLLALAACCGLLAAANAWRAVASNYLGGEVLSWGSILRGSGTLPAIMLITTAAMALAVRYPLRFLFAARTLLVWLSPFVLLTFCQSSWRALAYDGRSFADGPLAAASPVKRSTRVIWVIFDEWDQAITFDDRPNELALPELDAFRESSVYAANAYPPAGNTLESLPALITGRTLRAVHPLAARTLMFSDDTSSRERDWSQEANVFADARAAGFNTALAGWYHPYCRILNSSLTTCGAWEYDGRRSAWGSTFFEKTMAQSRIAFPILNFLGIDWASAEHTATYESVMGYSSRLIADPEYSLVFLHLPVPHLPAVTSGTCQSGTGQSGTRQSGTRQSGARPSTDPYLNNLALVDCTLGSIRKTLAASGQSANTSILLSSDHWYRAARRRNGQEDHRIPFLLKLPGQTGGIRLEEPFNTLLSAQLVMQVLRGEVVTTGDAASWIGAHRQTGKEALPHPGGPVNTAANHGTELD